MNNKAIRTSEIEVAVAMHFNQRLCLIIPNISFGFNIHECDLLIVNPNRFLYEVEIKTSFSDFKADFKKIHQHADRRNRIKGFYYAVPEYLVERVRPLLPEHAGLIVVESREFGQRAEVLKRCKYSKTVKPITDSDLMTLQRLALLRLWEYKRVLVKHFFDITQKIF